MAKTKTLMEGRRLTGFWVDPATLTLADSGWLESQGLDKSFFLYNETADKEPPDWLTTSVQHVGVKDAIKVHKYGDLFIVADGRKRYKAAMKANEILTNLGETTWEVPVIAYKGDEDELERLMILSNNLREEDSILNKAELACRQLARRPGDYKGTAALFKVTAQTVKNWEALMTCCPTVKKAVGDDKLAATSAMELSELTPQEQRTRLDSLLAEAEAGGKKKVSTRAAKAKAEGRTDHKPSAKLLREIVDCPNTPKDFKAYELWRQGKLSTAEAAEKIKWFALVVSD